MAVHRTCRKRPPRALRRSFRNRGRTSIILLPVAVRTAAHNLLRPSSRDHPAACEAQPPAAGTTTQPYTAGRSAFFVTSVRKSASEVPLRACSCKRNFKDAQPPFHSGWRLRWFDCSQRKFRTACWLRIRQADSPRLAVFRRDLQSAGT